MISNKNVIDNFRVKRTFCHSLVKIKAQRIGNTCRREGLLKNFPVNA